MRRIKYALFLIAFLTLFFSLFFCWDCVSKGVTKGMYLCVNIVIPSLFPVLCLCSVFAKTDIIEKAAGRCEGISRILFHQSGYALPVFLMSIISGYPVGAVISQSLCSKGCITVKQRDKLCLSCCSAGPAFVVLAVGVGMLKSYEKGVILLVANILSSVFTAITVSRIFKYENHGIKCKSLKTNFSDALVDGVSSATGSIINICAFTIIFSAIVCVLSTYLRQSVLFVPVTATLEVSNAVYVLCSENTSLSLVSAVIGFGGLSVICQVVSATKEQKISFIKVLAVRILHAINSYFFTTVILSFYKITAPVMKTTETLPGITEKNLYFSAMLIVLCVVFIGSVCKYKKHSLSDFFKM